MSTSRVTASAAIVPKGGRTDEECEDAAQLGRLPYPWGIQQVAAPFRVAVADGATESLLGGRWASILCKHFCEGNLGTGLEGAIASARAEWEHELGQLRRSRGAQGLSWLEEGALARGTFATIVGVEVADGLARAWAVGDSCLFVRRGRQQRSSFPVESAANLTSRPELVRAEQANGPGDSASIRQWEGSLESGDVLYLVTDAVAGWVLATGETGADPFPTLDRSVEHGPTGLAAWTRQVRRDRLITDDDCTIVRLALD